MALNIIKKTPMMHKNRNMGFVMVPSGQFAYQNAYQIRPDALQAQANVLNHVAESQAHYKHQKANLSLGGIKCQLSNKGGSSGALTKQEASGKLHLSFHILLQK